jgi:multisubunit Na+/H+ antiporter MnhC subunit
LSVISILLPYIFFCIAAFLLFSETRRKLVSGMGALMTTAILILFFIYRKDRAR